MTGSRAHFIELLERAADDPDTRPEVIREIEGTFGQERAVLVADMDSFTATTVEQGIISFLILLIQVQRLTRPILRRHGGMLLKSEADTLFCLFERVDDAVTAAREIRACLEEAGLPSAHGGAVTIAMGIGYGPMLNIGGEDALGAEVNFAYKLGEDVGRGGDILLTRAARARVESLEYRFDEHATTVSGLSLPYFRLLPSAT